MPLEAGDIVLVPFPHTNLRGGKRRPALVLTPATYNEASPDVIVAYVTAQPQTGPWSVEVSQRHLAEGSLPRTSWVRVDRLATLERRLILATAARLRPDALRLIRKQLTNLLSG